MNSQDNEALDSFDKESFVAEFDKVIPQMVAEISDLAEVRSPRITKRARREMAEEIAGGIEFSIPHMKALDEVGEDLGQVDEVYHIFEGLLRAWLRRVNFRLKPREDAFDCLLRKIWAILQPPYRIKRLKQYRITREGIERLVTAVQSRPGGESAARQLIEEFNRKHFKEYVRYVKALEMSLNSYGKLNLQRMTSKNINRLTEMYRDAAAAFEMRLRLLVGLNHIAHGEIKTYDELRRRGYNELLQAVDSPNNPLLHFLRGVVDRHVRNAMAHAGVSTSFSKGKVRFVDYAPHKGKETEVEWTMLEFYRNTKNLILTLITVAQVELLFYYAGIYRMVAFMHFLRANPQRSSPASSATASTSDITTSVTPEGALAVLLRE